MKKLTWTHFFFGLFGIALSTSFIYFKSPELNQTASIQSGTDSTLESRNVTHVSEESVALLLIQPTSGDVNLRQQPRIDSEIVGAVSQNALFEVTETCGETLAKVGRDGQWVKGRTADGLEGYTAAWLYAVVGVNNYTTLTPSTASPTTTVTTFQSENAAISVCQEAINDTTSASQEIATSAPVAESELPAVTVAATDKPVSAVVDEVQTTGTREGSSATPAVDFVPSSSLATPLENENARLFLEPTSQQSINIRAAPVDGSVVGIAQPHVAVEVIEPVDQALSKIDAADGWIMVRTTEGIEGYTAAWLYDLASGPTANTANANEAALVPITTNAPLAENGGLFVTPHNTTLNIRIRAAPINGAVVGAVPPGDIVLVIDPIEPALEKIGVEGEWIQVRTDEGVEGYTAAELYTAIIVPDAPATVEILPMEPTEAEATGFLPVQETEEFYAPNSVVALNLAPASSSPQNETIAPVGSGILALDVESPSASAPVPSVEDVSPQALETGVSSPLGPVENSLDDNTSSTIGNESPSNGAIPGSDNHAVLAPVNNIIPITVKVTDETAFETAEIAINDRSLARFYDEPYEVDLDAAWLSEGNYRLTFTAVSAENMLYADEMVFEIAFDNTAASFVPANGETEIITDSASVKRVVLIESEERPFALEFSVDKGLVPAAITIDQEKIPSSLSSIWSRPFSSLIPTPIRVALTVNRPGLTSAIILFMLILLLPQGIFTIYWMTYTWNNPQAADEYRSPKEFVESQFSFTALLPARHEADVIKDTIYAVDRINYPDHSIPSPIRMN